MLKTFWSFRLIVLNCRNIGVLQTTVAEMITVKEHQRRRFGTPINCHPLC